ncbi:MAG: cation:proton antiporter [Rhizobiales bacterium TMED28]|nr:cation:proton antiporter [Rhodobiaceae bacterium]OUT83435.1 MAG: cation:proton antiporter [Rhizobiales bacterium TMED28]|tara:strand:- start:512 stop:1018 length:507 start_codon:yes stop_codon:yes gene_type:complete
MIILSLMALTTLGIIKLRNLFSVVILSTIYSFLMATLLLIFDAVDVALTEAAVGAGISTVLMLTVLYYTKVSEEKPKFKSILPLIICLTIGGLLIYGTYGLPPFGASDTPIHTHVSVQYLERSISETGVPNVVTSVLASYRGFDTLGEVIVVFTAAIGVLSILKRDKI